MKSRQQQKAVVAAIAAQWILNIAAGAKAVRFVLAAQRDERNGFRYTAAIEWRRAAESFGSNTFPVEYCWQQWERIMRLPRRLALPIGDPAAGFVAAAAA